MVLLKRTASLSANLKKKKVHIRFPSRAHQRLDRVGGRGGWQKGLGLGKGDGVLRYRSDLGGGDFLIAGKNYCAMNDRLTRKIPYQYS